MQSNHPGLRAVCEAAARALGCDAYAWLAQPTGRRECRIRFDASSGTVVEDPQGDMPTAGVEALTVPFGGGRGVLQWARPESSGWSGEERALAESLAAVAAVACGESTRPEADPAAMVDAAAYYRTIFDHADAAIWVHDPADGRFLTVSQTACDIAGYSVEEYKALGFEGISSGVPPYTGAEAQAHVRHALETGGPHRFEWCTLHKEGRPLWVEVTLRSVTMNGVPRLLATGRSIDDRKAAEDALLRANQELERSAEHFRRLIENGNDLLMISAPDGALTYVSPSVERLLGYSPEELLALRPDELLHPDDVTTTLESIGRILAEPGVAHRTSWRIRHRDGSWREFDAIGRTLDPASPADGIVINGRDVTGQRAAEVALQRSEEHFRRLIEHSYDLVQVLDSSGRIVYTGPSVTHLLGYTAEEIAGGGIEDFMHPDDLSAAAALVTGLLAEPGVSGSLEYRVRHRDGSWRWLEAYARTLSPTSPDEGLIANARDVTDRYQAQEALRQAITEAERARAEAERANRAKSEFLSRMSHELRTPLNSILGFAQVLEDVDLPPEYRNGVRHILNGGRHLLGLIDEVLDIARIEADRLALSVEPVHLGAAMREAVDMVRPLAAARGVTVVVEAGPAAERYVHADRQRLAQVLLNLLSNAVKYNRPQGRVWISCAAFHGEDGAEWLAVRVRDEGNGIAAEHRDRVFVPFERLGAEHSGIEGTGLGLALSRHLARAMGGALTLEYTSQEGTAFRVELRLAADPLEKAERIGPQPRPAGADNGRTVTLLYLEDNLANLSLVETILLPRPAWRLIPALQGRLGLELAVEHTPDVILLDLHLPDLPGREVLRLLRTDPRTAVTPVVVISADATPRTVQTLLAEGADAFLPKPLDVRAFLPTVERLLVAPRSR